MVAPNNTVQRLQMLRPGTVPSAQSPTSWKAMSISVGLYEPN